jgi:hypothetical protein
MRHTGRLRTMRGWMLLLCGCVSILGAALIMSGTAHALSNYGPDPNDFSYGGYGFMITSKNSPNVVIPATDIKLYFKTAGVQDVSLIDADMCVPYSGATAYSPGDYRNTGGDNRDLAFYDPSGDRWHIGDRVTQYSILSGSYRSSVVYGRFNNSSNCKNAVTRLRVNVSKFTYDSSIGYYVGTLVAQTMPRGTPGGDSGSQNVFEIQLPNRPDVVGYDSSVPENAFGISRQHPGQSNPSHYYTNWDLRFGTPCNVGPITARGYTYDDDNGQAPTQPNPMWNELEAYKPNGRGGYTYAGNVPLTWYYNGRKLKGSGFPYVRSGPNRNSYYVYSGSERHIEMQFTAQPGYRYDWHWHGVYYINVMDFRLPFDSIYAVASCQAPPAVCGGVTENPGNIDPDTRFTVTAGFGFNSPTDAFAAYAAGDMISVKVQGPSPSNTFTYGPANLRPPPPNGSSALSATTGGVGPTGKTGTFDVLYSLTVSSGAVIASCSHSITIADLPYFNVVGGDVETGAGMMVNGACTVAADPKAGVVSWSEGPNSYRYCRFQMSGLSDGQLN